MSGLNRETQLKLVWESDDEMQVEKRMLGRRICPFAVNDRLQTDELQDIWRTTKFKSFYSQYAIDVRLNMNELTRTCNTWFEEKKKEKCVETVRTYFDWNWNANMWRDALCDIVKCFPSYSISFRPLLRIGSLISRYNFTEWKGSLFQSLTVGRWFFSIFFFSRK